jgi:hypothetical protein
MRPQKRLPWFQQDHGILYDTAEAFSKTIIGSQVLKKGNMAKTNK